MLTIANILGGRQDSSKFHSVPLDYLAFEARLTARNQVARKCSWVRIPPLPPKTYRALYVPDMFFFIKKGGIRKADPENDLNGRFPAVAFPQKSESHPLRKKVRKPLCHLDFRTFIVCMRNSTTTTTLMIM